MAILIGRWLMMLILKDDAIRAVNGGYDVPTWIYHAGSRVAKFKYVSTDGWRGYYDAIPVKKAGWTKLDSDWVTGDWEDAPEGHAGSDVEAKLENLAKKYEEEGRDVM